MSLHGNPILETAHLPDGRPVRIRVGVAEDPYIADSELSTVVLEVKVGGHVAAVMDTILNPDQESEALHLAERVRDGLASGELEPSVHSLGPLTDEFL
jgi:hypothetical protein